MKKLGIIGGGQLGKMTILEARKMDIYTCVLTEEHPSPASEISNEYIIGSLHDEDKIREISEKCDVLTYEIEHINVEVLKELEAKGKKIFPSSRVIEIIQDKSKQKELLDEKNIPTSKWKKLTKDNLEELKKEFGFPVVQKSCKGGYDGRGVFILKDESDIEKMIQGDSFFEEFIECDKEIAVMVARNFNGDIATYPVVEMVFDDKTNICDTVVAPARITEDQCKEAKKLALQCVEALDGVGIFGVEMFLTKEGKILINEVAPRPHNSGHYTIEACKTSQYEQFIRSVLNYSLGSCDLLSPACMVNILGEDGYKGKVKVIGMDEMMSVDGAYLHLYGKKDTKPFRKMGHITVLSDSEEEACKLALKAREHLKIISE
ncbi:5-(carboxyamino)imidazole ribonucleotide synthase [uncultured Ilyobacter sp.]|uniref:5-(carboxyamino)imidazole ribonucleotide synthase n=1 Tax=uncultured Ilyobacter sp. TaxID=544433 RepID=UPI0029BFB5C6|nr:5-(carboxyamino)imidazole ribonucleotide synthase [uncultured Ilyobacter sp.]